MGCQPGAEQGPSRVSPPLGPGQGGCVLSPASQSLDCHRGGLVVLNTNLGAQAPAAAQLGCTSGTLWHSWGARTPGGTSGPCFMLLCSWGPRLPGSGDRDPEPSCSGASTGPPPLGLQTALKLSYYPVASALAFPRILVALHAPDPGASLWARL